MGLVIDGMTHIRLGTTATSRLCSLLAVPLLNGAMVGHVWRSVVEVTAHAVRADTLPHSDPAPPLPLPAKATTAHLTVRPHTMATGIRNATAGLQILDSATHTLLYVPARCVGAHRVPLVVYLSGAGYNAQSVIDAQRASADRYGMILLAPEAAAGPGMWDVIAGYSNGETEVARETEASIQVRAFRDTDVKTIDAAMQQVLHTYAIDPGKIALAGFSNGGIYAMFLGRSNVDIFSRIAPMSAVNAFGGLGPVNHQKTNTQFFLSGGIGEDMVELTLQVAGELRHDGYGVTSVLALRPHVDYPVDDQYMWRWLANSWETPRRAAKDVPVASADSDPVLTVEIMRKMTDFWTRFTHEPEAIRDTARVAHQEPLRVWIGNQPASVLKANMVALAAQYPSVAVDLTAAGLTAKEEERYRTAILRVGFTWAAPSVVGRIPANTVLGQNYAFWQAHQPEVKALDDTEMWTTQ